MERRPDIEPHPASQQDLDGFEVLWAAEPGPIPDDVAQDLRELGDAVTACMEEGDGVVGTRFGHRVIVAPADAPQDAVDIADVDIPRRIVLTMGARDPTPEGALLAQILRLRQDVVHGFVKAPDVDGPSMDVLQKILPTLRGATGVHVHNVGHIALGRHPREVQGALESAMEQEEAHEGGLDPELDPDDLTQV